VGFFRGLFPWALSGGFFRGLFPGAFARQALPFGLSGRVPYPHEIENSHRMSLNSMRVIRDTRHMSSRTPFMRSIASLLVMLAISPAALADRSQPGPFAVAANGYRHAAEQLNLQRADPLPSDIECLERAVRHSRGPSASG
jgi:hypothetical protein